jgi:hypothetical protein
MGKYKELVQKFKRGLGRSLTEKEKAFLKWMAKNS